MGNPEAIAIYSGVELACETGLVPFEIESDAAVVVDWINEAKVFESEVGTIIDDIRFLMQRLNTCNVKFVFRKANYVAHFLAKLALSICEDQVWLEEYPSCVRKYLLDDFPSCVTKRVEQEGHDSSKKQTSVEESANFANLWGMGHHIRVSGNKGNKDRRTTQKPENIADNHPNISQRSNPSLIISATNFALDSIIAGTRPESAANSMTQRMAITSSTCGEKQAAKL
ncbi:hypothetical protein Dsin_030078 [Dipteronia sinensis]|uniref:RNase H type-1 domain-containing protein n=1 Tax=Dipteronia sinensis TaxID=43782 RepID=A0AAE0DQX1_9ROSI|nr:hypothetical protein Dsin_030078 [Dipteronia sinensis]